MMSILASATGRLLCAECAHSFCQKQLAVCLSEAACLSSTDQCMLAGLLICRPAWFLVGSDPSAS